MYPQHTQEQKKIKMNRKQCFEEIIKEANAAKRDIQAAAIEAATEHLEDLMFTANSLQLDEVRTLARKILYSLRHGLLTMAEAQTNHLLSHLLSPQNPKP